MPLLVQRLSSPDGWDAVVAHLAAHRWRVVSNVNGKRRRLSVEARLYRAKLGVSSCYLATGCTGHATFHESAHVPRGHIAPRFNPAMARAKAPHRSRGSRFSAASWSRLMCDTACPRAKPRLHHFGQLCLPRLSRRMQRSTGMTAEICAAPLISRRSVYANCAWKRQSAFAPQEMR